MLLVGPVFANMLVGPVCQVFNVSPVFPMLLDGLVFSVMLSLGLVFGTYLDFNLGHSGFTVACRSCIPTVGCRLALLRCL